MRVIILSWHSMDIRQSYPEGWCVWGAGEISCSVEVGKLKEENNQFLERWYFEFSWKSWLKKPKPEMASSSYGFGIYFTYKWTCSHEYDVYFCQAMIHLNSKEMIYFWTRECILRIYILFLRINHFIWNLSKFVANEDQVPIWMELGVGDSWGIENWYKKFGFFLAFNEVHF